MKIVQRIFILSPARTDGKRAELLLSDCAKFELARRLRTGEGATLGEAFAFLSGLYFRGKLTYARRFARPPRGLRGCYVITSDRGLATPEESITAYELREFSRTPIDAKEPRYARPLEISCQAILERLPKRTQVVLLGSVATGKYVDVLRDAFGDQLAFPREFVGRGDMSRGGLMLRATEAGTELEYAAIGELGMRTGKRPPRLKPVELEPRSPKSARPRKSP